MRVFADPHFLYKDIIADAVLLKEHTGQKKLAYFTQCIFFVVIFTIFWISF